MNARWDSPGNLEFWFHGHNLSEYETDIPKYLNEKWLSWNPIFIHYTSILFIKTIFLYASKKRIAFFWLGNETNQSWNRRAKGLTCKKRLRLASYLCEKLLNWSYLCETFKYNYIIDYFKIIILFSLKPLKLIYTKIPYYWSSYFR